MINLFHTAIQDPIYNGFVFFISVVPGASVGLAIIAVTIIVRFILLPFSHASILSQAKMREIAPEMNKVKEKHKDNKQEQAKQMMELYKTHKINPLSGCLPVIIQIPVILGLFFVFYKGLENGLSGDVLYSFVELPDMIQMKFSGIDLGGKSIILALLAGATQFFQIRLSMPKLPGTGEDKSKEKGPQSFKEELMKNMGTQMRYMLPAIVGFVAYTISGAVALYWVTSNTFSVLHELYVKRVREDKGQKKSEV